MRYLRLARPVFVAAAFMLLAMILSGGREAAAQPAADGDLDPNFGTNGVVFLDLPGDNSYDNIRAVAEAADGSLIAAGESSGRMALARFSASGTLDTSFGQDGLVLLSFPDGSALDTVSIGADGRITASGAATGLFAVARFQPDGSLDTSFGDGGIAHIAGTGGEATAMRIGADGKISLAGQNGDHLSLARLNADGTPDTNFGKGGAKQLSPGVAEGPIFDQQGRILTYSTTHDDANDLDSFNASRYLPDGSHDTSFGGNGTVGRLIDYRSVYPYEYTHFQVTSIAAAPDGQVVLAGNGYLCYPEGCIQFDPYTAPLVVIGADGSIINVVGCPGYVDSAFYTTRVMVQPDHKIVTLKFDNAHLSMGRVLANGIGYSDFADPRVAVEDGLRVNVLLYLRAGDLLVAGQVKRGNDEADFFMARVKNRPIYDDIAPSDYFYDAVVGLTSRNVVSGYGDRTFRPFNNTTRGQLAKIMVLAKGGPVVSPNDPSFTDVPLGSPFYSYITTAWLRGYVSGYSTPNGREFRPQNNITRGQLAKIIVSAQPDWDLLDPAAPRFSDVAPGSAFYRFVETAAAHTILSGYADGSFRPGLAATRGQISKVVYLLMQRAGQ